MEIKILGAHNSESATTRLVSLLIDDVLAIDAGGLTSSLSLPEQQKIKSILLTHHHYDHIRDIAAIGLNIHFQGQIKVYSTVTTLDILASHLVDGVIYPRLSQVPTPEKPTLKFCALEQYQPEVIAGYRVVAVPTRHSVPTVGYQVTSADGKSVFFSGDTGPGLSGCCQHISPQLLVTEVTLPNRLESFALEGGHMTPRLLKEELLQFHKIKGYLPPVALVHMSPQLEDEIRGEVEQVATELRASITLGSEGMKINI